MFTVDLIMSRVKLKNQSLTIGADLLSYYVATKKITAESYIKYFAYCSSKFWKENVSFGFGCAVPARI